MSLLERINIVNQKNTQRENELMNQLNSLTQSIKNSIQSLPQSTSRSLPQSTPQSTSRSTTQNTQRSTSRKTSKSTPQKLELFYELPSDFSISLSDIKSNRNYDFLIQYDYDILINVNVFELIKLTITNNPIKITTQKVDISLNPEITIPNAEILKENDIIVIKFHYNYEKIYYNYTVSLEDLGFDRVIT